MGDLKTQAVPFEAYCLEDAVFVVSLGSPALSTHREILRLLRQGGGYLSSLTINDHYRRFANHRVFQSLRRMKDIFR